MEVFFLNVALCQVEVSTNGQIFLPEELYGLCVIECDPVNIKSLHLK